MNQPLSSEMNINELIEAIIQKTTSLLSFHQKYKPLLQDTPMIDVEWDPEAKKLCIECICFNNYDSLFITEKKMSFRYCDHPGDRRNRDEIIATYDGWDEFFSL